MKNVPTGTPGFDPTAVRQQFGGVEALGFNERLALEAGRLQHAAIEAGSQLSPREAMIAATARSTDDEYVVAGSDVEIESLEAHLDVTNLDP